VNRSRAGPRSQKLRNQIKTQTFGHVKNTVKPCADLLNVKQQIQNDSICRARWCGVVVAPMVTDDATFHGLSFADAST
jgi:hypothetical protein